MLTKSKTKLKCKIVGSWQKRKIFFIIIISIKESNSNPFKVMLGH